MKIDGRTADELRQWFPDFDMGSVTLVQSGPVCLFVERVLRQGAMTFSPFVFYGKSRFHPDEPGSVALLAHELKHVQQYREMGHLRFLARYFLDKARNGFRYSKDLPLEKDAYELQEQVLDALKNRA